MTAAYAPSWWLACVEGRQSAWVGGWRGTGEALFRLDDLLLPVGLDAAAAVVRAVAVGIATAALYRSRGGMPCIA